MTHAHEYPFPAVAVSPDVLPEPSPALHAVPPAPAIDSDLHQTYSRYTSSLAGNRPASAAGTLARAEAVLRSRLALYDCLVARGWRAPEVVSEQLERDRDLVRLSGSQLPQD